LKATQVVLALLPYLPDRLPALPLELAVNNRFWHEKRCHSVIRQTVKSTKMPKKLVQFVDQTNHNLSFP
jgi:predicted PP-loop superfamily ATPase